MRQTRDCRGAGSVVALFLALAAIQFVVAQVLCEAPIRPFQVGSPLKFADRLIGALIVWSRFISIIDRLPEQFSPLLDRLPAEHAGVELHHGAGPAHSRQLLRTFPRGAGVPLRLQARDILRTRAAVCPEP